ncbi:hypothetical protein ACWEWG_28685 [Streptomyces sp. NPDC003758]
MILFTCQPGKAHHTTHRLSRRALPALAAGLILVLAAAVAGVLFTRGSSQPPNMALPLRPVTQMALPGDSSRFDYESRDPVRGLLFIAHLGASQLIEVDVHAGRVEGPSTACPASTAYSSFR